jgi:hypothetical protein
MALLVSWTQRLEFENASVLLETPGDHCIWTAGVPHSWTVMRDATVMTAR